MYVGTYAYLPGCQSWSLLGSPVLFLFVPLPTHGPSTAHDPPPTIIITMLPTAVRSLPMGPYRLLLAAATPT